MGTRRLKASIESSFNDQGTRDAERGMSNVERATDRTELEMAALKAQSSALSQKMSELGQAVAKGEKSFDDAEREMKQFRDTLTDLPQPLEAVGRGAETNKFKWTELSSAIGLAQQAFGAVQNGARVAWEALGEGAALEVSSHQFDRLTASIGSASDVMLKQLVSATNSTVSNADLISSASELMKLKLATTEEEVVRMSTVVGKLGLDMNVLGLTITNQSVARLDALGLAVADVVPRFNELKATMSDTDAFKTAVIEALENNVKLLGDASEETMGDVQRLETTWTNMTDKMEMAWAGVAGPVVEGMVDGLSEIEQTQIDLNFAIREGIISQGQLNAAYAKTGYTLDTGRRLLASVGDEMATARKRQESMTEAAQNSIAYYERWNDTLDNNVDALTDITEAEKKAMIAAGELASEGFDKLTVSEVLHAGAIIENNLSVLELNGTLEDARDAIGEYQQGIEDAKNTIEDAYAATMTLSEWIAKIEGQHTATIDIRTLGFESLEQAVQMMREIGTIGINDMPNPYTVTDPQPAPGDPYAGLGGSGGIPGESSITSPTTNTPSGWRYRGTSGITINVNEVTDPRATTDELIRGLGLD